MALDNKSHAPQVDEDPLPIEREASPDPSLQNQDQQDGVRVAEAVTAVWSKKALYFSYGW